VKLRLITELIRRTSDRIWSARR